ncbi:MAG: hypothetical protein WAN65_21495 [Candidatus Sulfotelmatobacter sp.]
MNLHRSQHEIALLAAANFALEFSTKKNGADIHVGDVGTFEGGLGRTFYKKLSGPIPMVMTWALRDTRNLKLQAIAVLTFRLRYKD